MAEKGKPSETAAVEAAPKVLTPTMWILIAVTSVLLSAFSITITAFTPSWMQWGNTFTPGNIGMIMFAIFLLLAEVLPSMKRINAQRYTVLWGVFTMIVSYAYGWVPMSTLDNMLTSQLWNPPYKDKFSMLWGPSLEIQQQQLTGGLAVPWGDYAPAIGGWIFLAFLWWFFMTSMVNIFRRQWLDVEALPFPGAYPSMEMVANLAEADKRKTQRRLFLVSGIIGFLFFLPQALRNVFAWFPDLYGFSKDPYIPWALATIDTTRTPLKDTLVGLNALSFNPSDICLAFIIPVDVLLSGVVSNIIFMLILPQIAYTMGYYQTVFTITWFNGKRDLMGQSAPFYFYSMGPYGMAVGVIVMWMILNWRYMAQTVKWARSPDSRIDAQEPLPFRWNYILLVVSCILLMGANMTIGGTSLFGAVMVIVVDFIQRGANSRSAGFGGPGVGDWPHCPGYINWYYTGITADTLTRQSVNDYLMISRPQNVYMWNNNSLVLLQYRLAKTTNTSYRELFLSMTVAMAISIIVSIPLALQLRYTFGAKLQRPLTHEGWWMGFLGNPVSMQSYPSADPAWYGAFAGGALIVVLVYIARSVWFWFPLEPIGVWAGIAGTSTMLLTSWGVAYILKKLTLRIGGVTLFEKKGIPLAVGFAVGWNLALFLSGALGIYRFFYPF